MMYIMMKNPAFVGPESLNAQELEKLQQPGVSAILELHWHVGEKSKPWPINHRNGHLVVAVQADGDELLAIIGGCINIPHHPNKRVQMWRGEMAQFIVDNLVGK